MGSDYMDKDTGNRMVRLKSTGSESIVFKE